MTLLSNLTDNFAEGLHKGKDIVCKLCVEYVNVNMTWLITL